jgi:hypothetical protein
MPKKRRRSASVDHLIRATRYYKAGGIRVEYWCGKVEVVPEEESFDVDPAKSRRGKSDCGRCWRAVE